MYTQQRLSRKISATMVLIVVLAAGFLNGYSQPLSTQYANIYNRVYQNVGTKYATRAILPNEVRVDSMYQMMQSLLGFTRNVADSNHVTSGNLNQVLANGNFSTNSIYLGEAVAANAYSLIRIINDSTLGSEVSVNDPTSSNTARLKMSGTLPVVQVSSGGLNSYITSDGAVGGIGGGVATYHISGIGTAPTLTAYSALGSSPTISISGSDLAGTITLIPGSSPAASDTICKITFNHAYFSAPLYANVGPANNNAGIYMSNAHPLYIPQDGITTTSCYIVLLGTALGAGTAYKFYYNFIK